MLAGGTNFETRAGAALTAMVAVTPTGTAASRDTSDAGSPAGPLVAQSTRELEPPVESLTILIPVLNEEGNLTELHRRLTAALTSIGLPYEILFVDDGSGDGTWTSITALRQADPQVRALRHRRNFGKAQALANGFAVANGDVIVTMDGDLQDDPNELPRFLSKLAEGFDVVSGWKQRRQDPLGKTAPSRVFNWTVRTASGVPLHDFNCGYKAYRREAASSLRLYGELHRFTPVLAHAQGFRIAELPVTHHPRRWGTSKYGWSRLLKGFLDLLTVIFLTQYRQRPMHLFGLPGLVALGLGILIGLYLSAERLINGVSIGNRPLLLLAVLLVVIGTQFFGLGLLGEFLAHGSNAPRRELRPLVRESLGLNLPATINDTWAAPPR
ncbi:MAG: glycosyltransferase family 2 protein [Chloroflexota bacterium]|nr:glycosyltransferase family 2 protein [Chloroflexota bacterium]